MIDQTEVTLEGQLRTFSILNEKNGKFISIPE